MDLVIVIPSEVSQTKKESEVSQTEKEKYHTTSPLIPPICII